MRYDFIFSGMGLSSLMILHKMIQSDLCSGKDILIIEAEKEKHNDRTWCFWEKGEGRWDSLLKKRWEQAYFVADDIKVNCLKDGYEYKMLESKSFYDLVLNEISQNDRIQVVHEKMVSFSEKEDFVWIVTEENHYEANYFFNSVLNKSEFIENIRYPLLQQHFAGWFVRSESAVFDDNKAVFMDFSVGQKGNTRFMYVLPVSAREALVEYTLFSPDLIAQGEYEIEIEGYLKSQGIAEFTIVAKEKGNIPMTAYPFWNKNSKRTLYIGTAGGWTKASTGYTFKNSDKLSDRVIGRVKVGKIDFRDFKKAERFTFYDSLFVKVLFGENSIGKNLFTGMFSKVSPEKILRFLDEESSIVEEIEIIWACPKWPFIKALFKK
ncbi:lycopene cyclase family protein [Flavobacterium amniphilum]|uniref:lycopene cyclase family protein n=1 Tax=Flavobacterium amniphilum TaxID=1834035 RepID=UPI002029BE9D|nr:lycopene cyclase family protein [Flavobacterium amniphilum]MCL9807221.1 lycopene cyclase family protein [Flavobacterium amniphilum]